MHWLVHTARRAALPQADTLEIDANASIAEAWAHAERHCGIAEDALVRAVAGVTGLAIADLAQAHPPARRLVPDRIARRWGVVALRETERNVVVATADPSNVEAEQAIAFASGRRVVFEIASPAMLHAALTVPGQEGPTAPRPRPEPRKSGSQPAVPAGAMDAAAVGQLAERILHEALDVGASDVHLEPAGGRGTIRLRVDGVFRPHSDLDGGDFERLVARFKSMARLATAVRTRPQEGRIRMASGETPVELRLATIPTRDGERATIRIPAPGGVRTLAELGALGDDAVRLAEVVTARSGLVLVAGPQGSGRTTTAYALACALAERGVPVTSIEDPIERAVPGVTQLQADVRTGLTVAALVGEAMSTEGAAILVGELRDRETADTAAQAAMKGHLVIAVLQASSALGAIDRLGELGLGRTRIAASLGAIVAQQLVRHVCAACAERVADPGADAAPVRAHGCAACGGSGYRGRDPVFEVVMVSAALRELVADGAPASLLQRQMRTGARGLDDSARKRLQRGDTTRDEVERVLGPLAAPGAARRGEQAILVADDDEIERHLACTLLAQHGFRAEEAADGSAALARLANGEHFAAVILDLHMPQYDGRQVLEQIRARPATAMLPVVVLTGTGDEKTEVELIDAGADDYLAKPLDPPRFLARVRAALRRAAA